MGRSLALTQGEIAQVQVLHEEGYSERQIANRISRSKTAVHNCITLGPNYGTRKSSGRPKVTTERDERKIVRSASSGGKSIREICSDFDKNLSFGTV